MKFQHFVFHIILLSCISNVLHAKKNMLMLQQLLRGNLHHTFAFRRQIEREKNENALMFRNVYC